MVQKKYLERFSGVEDIDFIYCKICQRDNVNVLDKCYLIPYKERRFFELGKHLSSFHKITREQYLEMFPDAKICCKKYEKAHVKNLKKHFETDKGKEYREVLSINMLTNNPMFNAKFRKNYYKSFEKRNKKISKTILLQYKNGTRTPHKYYGTHGWFSSIKNDNEIYYNSRYELAFYDILEQDDNVLAYESGNIRIPLYNGSTYFPDILVTYMDNSKTLVEVKPLCFLTKTGGGLDKFVIDDCPALIVKIEAAEEFCKIKGWKFEIWTEQCLKSC